MKITAQEIITEVAKSFFIKRDKVIGPVMDVYREIPKLVAIRLVMKYADSNGGVAGAVFKMKQEKIRAICVTAGQLLAKEEYSSAVAVERKIGEWIENHCNGCNAETLQIVSRDASEVVSTVREKRREGCKVFAADAAWFADRLFIIDGANVCHWGRDAALGKMSLEPLLWICGDLRRRGARFQVLFDASTAYMFRNFGEEDSARCYKCLVRDHAAEFREVPAGIAADAFILMLADVAEEGEKERVVISNDCYSEYEKEYPMVKDIRRRLPGMVMQKNVMFPSIRWMVRCGSCGYQPCRESDDVMDSGPALAGTGEMLMTA